METINKKQYKSKAFTVKSVMKNPRLNKLISDAWESPLGSTKRDKVRSVMKTLQRVNTNTLDGMGGGGFPMIFGGVEGAVAPMPTPSKRTVILPAAPRRRQVDGQGGPGYKQDGRGGPAPGDKPFYVDAQGNIQRTVTPATEEPAPEPKPTSSLTMGYTPDGGLASIPKVTPPITAPRDIGPGGLMEPEIPSYLQPVQPPKPKVVEPTPVEGPRGESVWTQGMADKNYQEYIKAGYSPAEAAEESKRVSGFAQPTPEPIVEPVPTVEPQTQWPGLSGEGILSGYHGPEHFASSVMADPALFKELFPNVPEGDIPFGTGLNRQVADLKNVLKKEYQVNEMLNRANKLQRRGATLQTDLSDYIRGRDEYLNEVNSMIDKADDAKFTMDMANPEVANKMEKYSNYLYILKGRQDKRYIEFLNGGIEQHNADVAAINTQYQTNMAAFQEEFKTQGAIMQEDYNRYSNMLKDMYTNLDGAIDKDLDRTYKQEQIYSLAGKTVNDLLEAVNKGSDIFPDLADAKKIVYDGTEANNILENFTEMYNKFSDANKNEGSITEVLSRGVASKLKDAADPNSKSEDDPLELFDTYMKSVMEHAASGREGSSEQASQIGNSLVNNMSVLMEDILKGEMPSIREAIRDLVGDTGVLFKGKPRTIDEKEDWKEEHSGVSPQLLDGLFDYYQVNIGGVENPTDLFSMVKDAQTGQYIDREHIKDTSDEELIEKILNGITQTWKFQVNEITS